MFVRFSLKAVQLLGLASMVHRQDACIVACKFEFVLRPNRFWPNFSRMYFKMMYININAHSLCMQNTCKKMRSTVPCWFRRGAGWLVLFHIFLYFFILFISEFLFGEESAPRAWAWWSNPSFYIPASWTLWPYLGTRWHKALFPVFRALGDG